ncbi:hypothetical protein AXW67_21825 [Bradyrhizobium neotropicale]|uniref:Uncharacterized protein n=2 Tax=Bradyrhizobium neotropicale TaxID=1497615 RepID=A0A176YVJ0_9BRAD|nr:hypothetical protein AXW67_21825 [Bradyrhizobium neotropicale]
MPTDLMRVSARTSARPSSARNANIVAMVLTAALVILQLVGLAMLERSHAQPTSPSSANLHNAPICTESADVPVPQTYYD